jgi:hypothetical protein
MKYTSFFSSDEQSQNPGESLISRSTFIQEENV